MIFCCGPVVYENDFFGCVGSLFTLATNMACLTLWLQCRCRAVTPNQFYIVCGHSYWWIMLGLLFPMIYHGMRTSVLHSALKCGHRHVLWYTTIHQKGWASCIESTPALMQSNKVSSYECLGYEIHSWLAMYGGECVSLVVPTKQWRPDLQFDLWHFLKCHLF
jgi:hypothetical protein